MSFVCLMITRDPKNPFLSSLVPVLQIKWICLFTFVDWTDLVSPPSKWLSFTLPMKYSLHGYKHPKNTSKNYTVFIFLSYVTYSLNNVYIVSVDIYQCFLVYISLYIYYLWIKCFYTCKWAYLVFLSVYSVLVYHRIYWTLVSWEHD